MTNLDKHIAAQADAEAKMTAGPWEVWDGCSWRRIGSKATDKTVVCPVSARYDNHPDLDARTEDLDGIAILRNAARKNVELMRAMKDALETVREAYGKVCNGFELCDHAACESSSGAWLTADAALAKCEEILKGAATK